MEQNELSDASLRKTKLEDDEWSLQVVTLPITGLLKALKGKCLFLNHRPHMLYGYLTKHLKSFPLDLQESVGGPSKLVIDSRLYAWAVGRELSF